MIDENLKLEVGKTYTNRDNTLKVTILNIKNDVDYMYISALGRGENGDPWIGHINGRTGSLVNSKRDLVKEYLEPVETTGYINIYPDNSKYVCFFHTTRSDADRVHLSGRVARVKVTFTPGQLDE